MGGKISATNLILAVFFSGFFLLHGVGEADSFPFRSVNLGDKLPIVKVRVSGSQKDVSLEAFSGKPLLLIFFGADIPAKKTRAIKAIKDVQTLTAFMEEKGIAILLINAQDDSAEVIAEVATAAGFTGQVYTDVDQQVYSSVGIFVMPSILLVSADGVVAAGMGYSRDLAKRLKGEVEIMLGDTTRAQFEEELHPQMVEKSKEDKGGRRHFNLGLTMIERGQPESALREFERAISLNPEIGEAHIYLGCLLLDDGKIDAAKISLATGLELEPDFIEGQICQARIKAASGNLDGAVEDITSLMLYNSRNDGLHYALGKILEQKLDHLGAMKEYLKAYDLLKKKSRLEQ